MQAYCNPMKLSDVSQGGDTDQKISGQSTEFLASKCFEEALMRQQHQQQPQLLPEVPFDLTTASARFGERLQAMRAALMLQQHQQQAMVVNAGGNEGSVVSAGSGSPPLGSSNLMEFTGTLTYNIFRRLFRLGKFLFIVDIVKNQCFVS